MATIDKRFIIKQSDIQRIQLGNLEAKKIDVKKKYKRRKKVERLKHARKS